MKKVEKVSIADISFTLDDDAYVSLKQYLDSLHLYYCKDPDGTEIIADIEARIAELILNEQVYTKVVSAILIESIITQLGKPEEIDDKSDEGKAASGSAGTSSAPRGASPEPSTIPRRLHRSNEGRILGGVCSGIAKYLDISVAWARLAFLCPILFVMFAELLGASLLTILTEGWAVAFFILYVVLWIALPMARTPRQKLEARGERITPASIRQSFQETATTPATKKAASLAAEIFTVLGRIILFFIKLTAAIFGFALIFASMACFIAMMVIVFDPNASWEVGQLVQAMDGMTILTPVWLAVLMLLCMMIPLLVTGMALLSFVFNWRLWRGFYFATLGLWGCAMVFCGIVLISNARYLNEELPRRLDEQERVWIEQKWRDDDPRRIHRVEIRTIEETEPSDDN